MDDLIRVATVADIADKTIVQIEVEGHAIVLARDGEEFYAGDARCPHLGGPLAKGILEGSVITCPWHHSQFDLADGRCLRWTDWQGAALSVATLARHPRPLRVYETRVVDGGVFIGPEKPPVG